MTQQHPITPPPELTEKWVDEYIQTKPDCTAPQAVAARAAQWGADCELEACCHYFTRDLRESLAAELRAARRPKPLSLKEQALEAVKRIPVEPDGGPWRTAMETIIHALHQLPD